VSAADHPIDPTPPAPLAPTPSPPSDWRAALGEMGQAPALSTFTAEELTPVPKSLVKSYLDTKAFVGTDKIAKPQENWTDEQWSKFYGELGRPEAADKYTLPEVKLPEGVQVDEGLRSDMLASAHKAGLTNQQFAAMYQDFLARQATAFEERRKAETEAHETWVAEQKRKLGSAYEANVDLANRALAAAGAGPQSELLAKLDKLELSDGTPFLSHPAFIDLFGALGKALHEGNLLPGEKGRPTYGRTKEQLDREVIDFEMKHGAKLVAEGPESDALRQQWNAMIQQRADMEIAARG